MKKVIFNEIVLKLLQKVANVDINLEFSKSVDNFS